MIIDFYNLNGGGGGGERGPQGPQGPQGAEGAQGPQGNDGANGIDGAQGPEGPQGAEGSQGANGINGSDGPQGPEGPQGADGPQGPEGPQGPAGMDGKDGKDGFDGIDGKDGADGPQGPQGPEGAQGPAGSGGGGDNTILKATSGTPAGVQGGDVYAVSASSAVATWIDSGVQNASWARYWPDASGNPINIRIQDDSQGVQYVFSYACDDWNDEVCFFVNQEESGGVLYMLNGGANFDGEGTAHLVLSNQSWLAVTGGKKVYIDLDGNDVYFRTDDNTMIWLYGVSGNSAGNIFIASTVQEESYHAYQYDGTQGIELVKSNDVTKIVRLSQAEYEALVSGGTVDSNTLYIIVDSPTPPTPTAKTLVITNAPEASAGVASGSMSGIVQGGGPIFEYLSFWNDAESSADTTVNIFETAFTYTYSSNTLTITGPFSGAYDVTAEVYDDASCLTGNTGQITANFSSADTVTLQISITPDYDQECLCEQEGGVWDGNNCIIEP